MTILHVIKYSNAELCALPVEIFNILIEKWKLSKMLSKSKVEWKSLLKDVLMEYEGPL